MNQHRPRSSSTTRMAGEDKARKFFIRYKSFFVFLGFILIAQFLLAFKLIFIPDNEVPSKTPLSHSEPIMDNQNERDEQIRSDLEQSKSKLGQLPRPNFRESKVPIPSFLEELNFKPNCVITGKDAISAIRRAKTQYCKEHLANITCLIANDILYPKRLPRFCKREDTTYMKHVGCFPDDKDHRLLNGYYVLLKETNSPNNCVDVCLQSGFPYAGLQYSVECFCGNTKPSVPTISIPSECNMKCPLDFRDENSTVTCGGYFVVDVYETGVFREKEVSQQPIDLNNASEQLLAEASKDGTTRIVFFLTLNGRALRQVIRLLKSLYHERHYFYIHVDARQDYMFRELLAIGHKLPKHIQFMRDRKSTIWGGASLLKILLSGMKELVRNSEAWDWHWDYVINLSESDFPLKTVNQLETFLTINKGKNFLKSHGRDVQNFILKQGLDKTFVECEYRMWRIGDRKLPAGILMDGGSDWVGLHRDFVKYVVTTEDDLVTGLLAIFDHTLLPAESFFHIVLRNSEMCHTFIDNNLHVTNWKRKLGCKCQYKNIVDWCGCSPNDFRLSDWNRLQDTQGKLLFFGRKFEAVVSQGIINHMESHLYPHRLDTNYPTLDSYWQNVYHHHDLTPKPDDSLLTLGTSLGRIAGNAYLQKLLESDHFREKELGIGTRANLQEMSVYVQNDRVAGILTRYDILMGEIVLTTAESWFKLENWVTYEPWSSEIDKYHGKIQHLQVGSDYDQKEQIFRNFAGSLGPLSEPTLAYHVYADESLNLTFVWANPLLSVQAVQNFTSDIGTTANFAKPSLRMPLLPGNWTVKVLTDGGHLVAHTVFMVSVAEFYHGHPISLSQNKILNGVLLSEGRIGKEEQVMEEWTSIHLHDTIDDQTKKFYELQDTCLQIGLDQNGITALRNAVDASGETKLKILEPNVPFEARACAETSWSTTFPDPKSSITGIDPRTGMLLP